MSMGSQSSFAIDTVLPLDGASTGIEIQSESLAKAGNIIETSGIRGTRQHVQERTRNGNYAIGGTIEMFPSPEELKIMLFWITGTDHATVFTPAETVPSRVIGISRGGGTGGLGKCFTYGGCYVSRATIGGSEGEPMALSIECIGQTETIEAAGAFATATVPMPAAGGSPFIFTDSSGAFYLGGNAIAVKSFSMTIDNLLDVAFNNSVSASRITAADLAVSCSITTPYSTVNEVALYDKGVTGMALSAVFTHTLAYSLTIAGFFQPVSATPVINGKGEIVLRLDGMLRKTGSTAAYTLTLDSTP